MRKLKKIVAVFLALFVTMQQIPDLFFKVLAFEGYHYVNDVVEIITENESNVDSKIINPETGETMTLPEHLLKINVTVDGEQLEESLDLFFNKDNPGQTVVKALEGYELEFITCDNVKVEGNALDIAFAKETAETKVLEVLVKKVVKEVVVEEKVQPIVEKSATNDKDVKKSKQQLDENQLVLYVSSNAPGDETAPIGTVDHPYKSLNEAVTAANEKSQSDITIELLSDLNATECARINGKNITLVGNGHTITRGDKFDLISDNARSWYNPAMIEVCNSTASQTASLYLVNITLDDAKRTAGTRYAQATTDGKGGNADTVQDAIIATYDGVGTITLGNHTTLKGYGGMSAVRLSGGTLIMESGSLITGGKTFTTKGGGNGPAGAIWSQGGKITINEGAFIDQVQGRAMYLDGNGSEALVNGTISNIIENANMWNGSNGTAMHVRNESKVMLGETGHIQDIRGGSAVVYIQSSSFEAKKGSVMSGTHNTRLMDIWYSKKEDNVQHLVYLDGTITDCEYNDVMFNAFAARYEIGPNANIKNNNSLGNTHTGLFYLNNGGEITIGGEIHHNNNKVVYMGNQTGGQTYLKVVDGAYIHHNEGTTSYTLGPKSVLFANNGGWIIVEGGVISDNTGVALLIRSKSNWPNAKLEMSGGKIINNSSYGIQYITDAKSENGNSYVNIDGGEIYGNKSTSQISILGNNANDLTSRIHIAKGVIKNENDKIDAIGTTFGIIYNVSERENYYIGNAKSSASNKLSQLVRNYKASDDDLNDYKEKGSALWLKPSENTFEFMAKRPSSINGNLPLYVAYIPLNEDGTPKDVSKAEIIPVTNDSDVNIKLDNLVPVQSYAVMWMQPSEKFGSLAITGDTEVHEELGKHHYEIDYKVIYSLPRDIKDLLDAGHEFTVNIQLDKRIDYAPQTGEVKLPDNSPFEIVSVTYSAQNHTIKVGLKLKDQFYSFSKAELSFKASVDLDEVVETTFESDATVSSSLVLSEDNISTPFTLKTVRTAQTKMIPLPKYDVNYTGGSERVKEGTTLEVDTDGGVMNIECPEKVMEDINLPDPTKDGYIFAGWEVEKDETSIHFTALYHELYTVSFVDYDGRVLSEVKVEAGKDAQAPQNPERDGYRFIGWDKPFSNVQSDLTVTALYNQLFTVTFVDYDGTVLDTQVVENGNAATAPQAPQREGYRFTGWDSSFTNVQSNLIVTAQYEAEETPVVPVAPEAPTTPTTPVVPDAPVAPTPAPTVVTVAPAAPVDEVVDDNDTPLANLPEDVVDDNATPLAGGTWALVNLICTVVTVLFGFILLISKKKKEEDEVYATTEEKMNEKKRGTFTRIFSVIIAIVSVIAFILTEDVTLRMVMTDKWTIMMLVMTIIQIVVFALGRKWKDKEDKNEQAYQQA